MEDLDGTHTAHTHTLSYSRGFGGVRWTLKKEARHGTALWEGGRGEGMGEMNWRVDWRTNGQEFAKEGECRWKIITIIII